MPVEIAELIALVEGYEFECPAGNLRHCTDWLNLADALRSLAEENERLRAARTDPDAWRAGWEAGRDAAADVVDQCNREGPYNAIGAASRIRALTPPQSPATPPGHVLVPVSGEGFEAMVERALDAVDEDFIIRRGTGHRAMRAALRAALGEHGDG
jgi:hypothetical protein